MSLLEIIVLVVAVYLAVALFAGALCRSARDADERLAAIAYRETERWR